jgi:excisionase family DNA binding protein
MSVTSPVPAALLVDLRTAAKMLSISTRTAWQLAADGVLPCVRIGRRLLFSLSALEQFVAGA